MDASGVFRKAIEHPILIEEQNHQELIHLKSKLVADFRGCLNPPFSNDLFGAEPVDLLSEMALKSSAEANLRQVRGERRNGLINRLEPVEAEMVKGLEVSPRIGVPRM